MERKQANKKKGLGRILRLMLPKCIRASFPLWLAMICADIFYSLSAVVGVWLLQRFFDHMADAVNGTVPVKTVLLSFVLLGLTRFLELCLNFSQTLCHLFSVKRCGENSHLSCMKK